MSLILGVAEGDTIFINDVPLKVVSISNQNTIIKVLVEGIEKTLNNFEFAQVLPSVFAAVGVSKSDSKRPLARLAFDAPKSIRILRESVLNKCRS